LGGGFHGKKMGGQPLPDWEKRPPHIILFYIYFSNFKNYFISLLVVGHVAGQWPLDENGRSGFEILLEISRDRIQDKEVDN
jgi:hypothetical protein